MSIAAQSYFAALIHAGDTKTFLKHGKIGHLFRSDLDAQLFDFVDSHVRTYKKLPDAQTVLTHSKIELPNPKEPSEYYRDLLHETYVEMAIRDAASKATKLLSGEAKDPLAALTLLRNELSVVAAKEMAPYVVDYREAGQILLNAYKEALLSGDILNLRFGWPTLDAMAGGIEEGDVVSFVGKPAVGKSWLLLWAAIAMWLQGHPILFASMEIKPKPILQRVAAIHAQKPYGALKSGTLTTFALGKFKSHIETLPGLPHPFWVVDGNLQATVADLEALALQLGPGVIFIDGAYLLRHPTEKDRYRRVAENMDLIKQRLAAIAPTVCSWQFNREARKLKKGEQPDLEHIGYSDAIGQHSSLVLGLFEDDSIETEVRRRVSVLKGRNGEVGQFFVKWNFHGTTDFSEYQETAIEDLKF